MGIRCVCPQGHVLNIKPELAGKQGICPKCGSSFTIEEVVAPSATSNANPPSSEQPSAAKAIDKPAISEQVPPVPEAVEWRLANAQGEQFGPTVPTLFAQWITQGRVPPDWLVWRTGWSDWRRADEAAAELPAPLPQSKPSETPPPLAVSELSAAPPQPTQTSVQQSAAKPSPVNEYALRRQRAVKRQRILIVCLGVMSVVLVGLLIWIAVKPT